MRSFDFLLTAYLLSNMIAPAITGCDSHSPAFPLPDLRSDAPEIRQSYRDIKIFLDDLFDDPELSTTSFSIEVTSQTETLFELHHTAAEKDEPRSGAEVVDRASCYRIASVTKAFTVLALIQQQIAGKLNLDDTVNKYISGLGEKSKYGIPWKDISLRSLASQLSGIPRDIGQQDLLADLDDPIRFGLPPVSGDHVTKCDSLTNYTKPCTSKNLLEHLDDKEPLFPPKQQSTYSNLNYELLSLVLENVTGMAYEDYITKHILKDLNLSSTSFSKPLDSVAVLPKGDSFYWDVNMGIQKATGGLYSSSADLAKFARYVLTHYNGLTPALNWLNPVSYSTGINTFYGMPWEIFRTNEILSYTERPVTFVTKGGGLPAYSTLLAMIPELGIGMSILVAGDQSVLMKMTSVIGPKIVLAAESIAQKQVSQQHVGNFVASKASNINSSFSVSHNLAHGLFISSWISNSTDALDAFSELFLGKAKDRGASHLQLVPTLLFKDEANQAGEVWRIVPHKDDVHDDHFERPWPFQNFCVTDIDTISYGGLPLNEVVFWSKDEEGVYTEVELTGLRIKLKRDEKQNELVDGVGQIPMIPRRHRSNRQHILGGHHQKS